MVLEEVKVIIKVKEGLKDKRNLKNDMFILLYNNYCI